MSTGQLIESRGALPTENLDTSRPAALPASKAPRLIALALLVVVLYAAFDHGAVALSADTRLEVAIAVVAAIAAAGWLVVGVLRPSASRAGIAGTLLLAAFACWCGVTLVWSVAPDQTWIELNRAIAYVLVLCLAIAIGASDQRALPMIAGGYLAVALAVTVYALGQKLVPGLHIRGIFNLDQTGPIPRLQQPLGYWNALALFITMAVPIALAKAADGASTRRRRIASACALQLMLLTIGLAYSRGGLLALALALAVAVGAGGSRLRSMLWLAAAVAATIPPLVFGLVSHRLTTAGASLSSREGAGAILAGILIVSLAALVAGGRALLAVEPRLRIDAPRGRRLTRGTLAGAATLLVCGVLALVLTGVVAHAWRSFTSTQVVSNYNPNRLLTTASNRWVWWKEAAGAFGDRPVGGWGAGSFGVVHLLYRRDTLPVQQPHSVPLQFLAETGTVGAVLALAAFGLLLWAAAASVRRRTGERGRAVAAALLAGAVAYAFHSLYDWDWNIPALTLPALLFIGVLVGSSPRRRNGPRLDEPGSGTRALALGLTVMWLCAFALSAALPSVAASEASSALVEAAGTSPAALSSAQSSAELASSLDPLSDAGLRAEATIALHRGRLARAREYLHEAVARDPSDVLAWSELAEVDGFSGHRGEALLAAQRVIALDPEGQLAQSLRSVLLSAPPRKSATATKTPLPPK